MNESKIIENGQGILGLELGSTRIKAVLIGPDNQPLSMGVYTWENSRIDNIWTYSLDDVWTGIDLCYRNLADNVFSQHGVEIRSLAACGVSAMMHGYLPFNMQEELLVPFRTWRNNITMEAAKELTSLFDFAIPQRWSIAHLHQAILNGESHVQKIAFLTTLSGYVHWKLTGQKIIGIGDASGMFPVNNTDLDFESSCITRYDTLISEQGFPWELAKILPKVIAAGEEAGILTETGAHLLDSSGKLLPGVPFCPPEGDAGTGMVATNTIRTRTGNVSAGTSVFAMLVMEKNLSRAREEIDIVSTPDGKPVGMAHSNNCTTDYDMWIDLLGQAASALGSNVSKPVLYETFLNLALQGDPDCGGLLAYGYVSGEHLTGFSEGRPLFVRHPDKPFSIENFMRVHLFTSLCALRMGLNVLTEEDVRIDQIKGHGGFFKTAHVGQRIMAAASRVPVALSQTASEGGAWGIALLAAFMQQKNKRISLENFLDSVFSEENLSVVHPNPTDVEGFNQFFERYQNGLPVEAAAIQALP